jgi:hypothetical protein
MKFNFNPTLGPTYNSPGMFLLLVDYSIDLKFLLIPLLLFTIILVVSFYKMRDDSLINRISLLIPFIIALFVHWSLVFEEGIPVHPTMIDILFISAIYISLQKVLGFTEEKGYKRKLFSILFPFIVFWIFILPAFKFNNQILSDALVKTAFAIPIISFSFEFISVSLVLALIFSSLFIGVGFGVQMEALWLLRFSSLVLIPFIYKKINFFVTERFPIFYKNSKIKKFIIIYASFVIIWNFYTPFVFIIKEDVNVLNIFLRYFIIMPTLISFIVVILDRYCPLLSFKDDLRLIKGISKTREDILNEIGIFTFNELIEADIRRIKNKIRNVSTANISKWKKQAKKYADEE